MSLSEKMTRTFCDWCGEEVFISAISIKIDGVRYLEVCSICKYKVKQLNKTGGKK